MIMSTLRALGGGRVDERQSNAGICGEHWICEYLYYAKNYHKFGIDNFRRFCATSGNANTIRRLQHLDISFQTRKLWNNLFRQSVSSTLYMGNIQLYHHNNQQLHISWNHCSRLTRNEVIS